MGKCCDVCFDNRHVPLLMLFITGCVLNVETTTMKAAEGFLSDLALDPDHTWWHEEGQTHMRRYTQIIRVFYVIGQPANEEIGRTGDGSYVHVDDF
jgi:hypothetical protein